MIVLGLNTSGEGCEAALIEDHRIRADLMMLMTKGHDSSLPGVVEQVLARADRRIVDIDRVAVIVGPGSFTGIRVGVAFARGLSLALACPAVGVTSLEALSTVRGRGRELAILPARSRPPDLSWWGQELEDGVPSGPPFEEDREAICLRARSMEGLIGEPGPDLRMDIGLGCIIRQARPTAAAAALRVAAIEAVDRLPPARPVYIRPPDAVAIAQR
jgi:tRNA threonylcarbamoyladenosine biosynthesis protein TsaB